MSGTSSETGNIDAETLQQKVAHYADRGVSQVKLGLTDIDGVIRGKYVGIDKFISLLKKQGGFCDCIFGWDVMTNSTTRVATRVGTPDFPTQAFASWWKLSVGCPMKIAPILLASLSGLMAPTILCVLVPG